MAPPLLDNRRVEPARPLGRPKYVRRTLLLALAVAVLTVAGCASAEQSPEIPDRYRDPEVGAARLMADQTARVSDVVNVTSEYPDPANAVEGAAVLIDDGIGESTATTDFKQRPVFIVYVSGGAAEHAVAGRPARTYLRNGTSVIYLPAGVPKSAREVYEAALGIALQ